MEFGNMEELIFGENSFFFDESGMGEDISDEELNEFGIIETGEEPEVAGYAMALENEQNFNAIMNAMMVKEYACLESTGTEMVYTEGVISDFFDAVKTTIKKWWGKFMDMIKKAQDKIIQYTRENGAFIKKYKGKKMDKLDPTKKVMDVHGYSYTKLGDETSLLKTMNEEYSKTISRNINALNADSSDAIAKVKETMESRLDNFDEEIKKRINLKAGTSDKVLSEAVKAYYRGTKGAIEVGNFSDLIKEMEQANKIRKKLKNDYDEAKKAMQEFLKSINTMQKACSKKDDTEKERLTASRPLVQLVKKTMNAMGKIQSASNQVYFEKCKADRAKAMWIINHQVGANNESTHVSEGLGITIV